MKTKITKNVKLNVRPFEEGMCPNCYSGWSMLIKYGNGKFVVPHYYVIKATCKNCNKNFTAVYDLTFAGVIDDRGE
jgi:hypothetical protein